ncbi:hypothetical protein NIES4071_104890 (plasmid) [Calothrix sp. NIES-4071]|nr:hypothetical protein NIES4071_104890 [Calothrix sp. NIES-4071]BAZ64907.1 hypothetical protein NIES4105_106400 [Calothrix sp. NIES-4105]
MKTTEELKARAHELTKLAASYARQAGEIIRSDRRKGLDLMKQAYEASQRSQVIVGEVLRRERMSI